MTMKRLQSGRDLSNMSRIGECVASWVLLTAQSEVIFVLYTFTQSRHLNNKADKERKSRIEREVVELYALF